MQNPQEEHTCDHAYARQPSDVCPPCQAPCNPDAPPTPTEGEAAARAVPFQQTEESFKSTIEARERECAVLRAEVVERQEEAERERSLRNEAVARLEEIQQKFSLLGARALDMLEMNDETLEQEVAVSTLKQCYHLAREEIDDLRRLQAEQNLQVQDYSAKYQHAQQTIEEQKRQLSKVVMDNTKLAGKINLELQRIKLKMLLYTIANPPPEEGTERSYDEMVATAEASAGQLAETNTKLKQEIERLKLTMIRMEETVLTTDKRLQEKMHECAALGGELKRAREHAKREILLANQRMDTAQSCFETIVMEMERKMQQIRAQLAAAELDRDETRKRMQCQLIRLEKCLEQGELRVLTLASEAAALRRAAGGDDADEQPEHMAFFEMANP